MRCKGFLILALGMALCGCSETQEQPAATADYESYAAVIAQLDEVQSYRVSTVAREEDDGEDYDYEERSETQVNVGAEGDSASETTMSYHVYEDGTSKDVTCSSSELEGSDQEAAARWCIRMRMACAPTATAMKMRRHSACRSSTS